MRRARDDQSGALTPAAIILAIFLLFLGGLIADGGRQLNTRSSAMAYAEEAARAGASMVKLGEANAKIDVPRAKAAIRTYCAQAMAANHAIVDCDYSDSGKEGRRSATAVQIEYVDAVVTMRTSTLLLGIFGANSVTTKVTARADSIQGVKAPGEESGLPSLVTPSYPTISVSVPTSGAPGPTTFPNPSSYPTSDCNGDPTTLPVTIGITCVTTTITSPPPPRTTVVPSTHPTRLSTTPTTGTPTSG